jgi:hypothetical protein
MREQMEARLQQLAADFERGQRRLAESEREHNAIRDTLLRISGAIQVIQEELARQPAPGQDPRPTAASSYRMEDPSSGAPS